MKISVSSYDNSSRRIYAAEDDTILDDVDDDIILDDVEDDDIADTIDNMAEDIEDIQDTVDSVKEDDVDIEIDNNIDNHYIAECDQCQGLFISAVVESDQYIEKITGVCPLCNKESDQYLKWVVKSVSEDE